MKIYFFGFFQLKNSLTYDSLGFVFQTDGSNAQRTFTTFIELMEPILQEEGQLPKSSFERIDEFETLVKEEDICLDATEIPIQRPENKEVNRATYSEKKSHRLKSLLITNPNKRILYLSPLFYGSVHDYSILKEAFDKKEYWFKNRKLHVDLGFLGIKNDYLYKDLSIPHKRKKSKKGETKSELTNEQNTYNKKVSSIRVVIEHSIGGMKRLRILAEKIRLKSIKFINKIMAICAGI